MKSSCSFSFGAFLSLPLSIGFPPLSRLKSDLSGWTRASGIFQVPV